MSSDHNAEISETAPDATKESNINGPEESSLPRVEDESPTKSDVNEQAFCDVMGFNLASQEGQEHLRELNEELKALNEQGSPKLSLLHGPAEGGTSNSQECMDLEVKRNNKKRKRNVGHCSAMGSPVASKNSPERMHASKKKVRRKLLCTNDGEPSCSADSLEKRDDDKLLDTTEDEIDKILEEKAWKANLTTVNVKNILRVNFKLDKYWNSKVSTTFNGVL